mgnify:CR=1 FL=1
MEYLIMYVEGKLSEIVRIEFPSGGAYETMTDWTDKAENAGLYVTRAGN